jgi:hypothetical protein
MEQGLARSLFITEILVLSLVLLCDPHVLDYGKRLELEVHER